MKVLVFTPIPHLLAFNFLHPKPWLYTCNEEWKASGYLFSKPPEMRNSGICLMETIIS